MTLRLGNKKVCPTKLVKINNIDWDKISYAFGNYLNDSTTSKILNGKVYAESGVYPRGTETETGTTKFVNFSQPFEINIEFTAPTVTNRNHVLFGNGYSNQYFHSPACEYQANSSNVTFWAGLSTSGSTWNYGLSFTPDEIPKVAGDIYNVNYKYDGSRFTLSVTHNNITLTKSVEVVGTPYYNTTYDSSGTYFSFGKNAENSSTAFKGYFHAWNTYIKQNDVLVWGCEKGRNYVEVDPNNYLISNVVKVGAISDNKGVLSGFNSTNYVKLPLDISTSSANSWEVVIPFRYSQAGTENQILLGYSASGSNRFKSPQIYLVNGGRIEICFSSNGSSWDIASAASSTNTLTLNRDYIAKLSFNGTEYKLEISNDNGDSFETWITVQSSTKSYGFYSTSLGSGGSGSAMFPINGLIDLNGCSLKVDSQTVWEGIVPQGTRG